VKCPAQLVDDQGGQRLPFHFLRHDEKRLARTGDLLEQGQQVLHVGDLLFMDQDVRLLENDLHPLRVGDEVGGEVAAVELHPLDDFEGRLHPLGLLDGDDSFLANL